MEPAAPTRVGVRPSARQRRPGSGLTDRYAEAVEALGTVPPSCMLLLFVAARGKPGWPSRWQQTIAHRSVPKHASLTSALTRCDLIALPGSERQPRPVASVVHRV